MAACIPEDLADRMAAMDAKSSGRTASDGSFEHVSATSGSEALLVETISSWQHEVLEEPKNRLAVAAVTQHGKDVLTQRSAQQATSQTFNVKIALEGAPVTNQRSSGRCWLFAATNVFRVAIMKRYNLKELELSPTYLFFWDKLEKANFFLEQILQTAQEPLDGRLVQTLLASPVGDGGQWDMVANLVEKYGLVPLHQYPDTYNSQHSAGMVQLITTKLRQNALELRQIADKSRQEIDAVKDQMLRDIHRILIIMLGPPPSPNTSFVWEYYDKDDKFGVLETTPLQFARELSSKASVQSNSGMDIHQVFSLVNDPRNEYGSLLSVSRLGNVVGMRGVRYVNVDMDTMKQACIGMLKADIPIFFGSDVGKFSSSQSGIMDTDLIDYELGFNVQLGLNKAQRLMTGESAMTHAMVLTAVHLDPQGNPVRWRVQNSWGETAGSKGWFAMHDRWMSQFVYQAVVDPKFVSKEIHDVLNMQPIMLDPWDPMGALAFSCPFPATIFDQKRTNCSASSPQASSVHSL